LKTVGTISGALRHPSPSGRPHGQARGRRFSRLASRGLALALALGATACATRPDSSDPDAVAEFNQTNDPIEPFNRSMFGIHQAIDRNVLRPAAVGYRAVVPDPLREGIHNALGNLKSPVTFINDVAQGEAGRARDTLTRFLLNSTVGLGGLIDVADKMGLPAHTADFGQTAGKAGLGEGPYLFIPLLGPSNPRDLTGFGAGIAANPFTYLTFGSDGLNYAYDYGIPVLTGLDTRERLIETLDSVNRSSLDPYATYRSGYRQQRARDIASTGPVWPPGKGPNAAGATPEGPASAPVPDAGKAAPSTGLGAGTRTPSQR